ncbi:unnamed protein product [Prorocentrum cordatum]|uniref:Uncharacterized protein n=1 Tax=Prorocentrum cordatum TaxID=2364126 RepID=A0ABN9R917_9DINO|nr:unnamed protein product [Polarella glacialis]
MLFGFSGERKVHRVISSVERAAQRSIVWGKSRCTCFASLDVLRAFDHVTVANQSNSMDRLGFPPDLACAVLEAQATCKVDFKVQDVEVCGVSWDRCVRAGSVGAPLGWMCKSIVLFGDLCQSWCRQGVGVPLTAETGRRTFSRAFWADSAPSAPRVLKGDAP